jgi:hypothetical protein
MFLSFILCSRNDAYCGDSVGRLQTTINHLGNLAHEHACIDDVEIVLSDWASDIPLERAIVLNEHARRITRFNYLPKEKTSPFRTPFSEVLSLNAAARISKGSYLLRIDQDTLVGPRFFNWCLSRRSGVEQAYFAGRRDRTEEQSARCRPDPLGYIRAHGDQVSVWNPAITSEHPLYWLAAVGVLMIPQALFFDIGGYDERNIFYNHMEHELILRLKQVTTVTNLGPELGYDFYHQFHVTRGGAKENPHFHFGDKRVSNLRPNGSEWGLLANAPRVNRVSLMWRLTRPLIRLWGRASARFLRRNF